MELTSGSRIGPYEISAKIGEGGMGEVFRAVDVNLGRTAAIKVLPSALAADPERLARFEREAQTLAALNHPNIAQVFGFEKGEGHSRSQIDAQVRDRLRIRRARRPDSPKPKPQAPTLASMPALDRRSASLFCSRGTCSNDTLPICITSMRAFMCRGFNPSFLTL